MAVVQPVYTRTGKAKTRKVSWTLANGDVGARVDMSQYSDKTVDIGGTFGAAGSVTLRGSNQILPDPTDVSATGAWAAVTDPQANAITKTAKALEAILENPTWMSPQCTAGDGTTAITVTIQGRK
jgi:hypothetical protein